jgi:hypothetical protein
MYSYGIINPAPTKKRSSSATSMILEIDWRTEMNKLLHENAILDTFIVWSWMQGMRKFSFEKACIF